MGTDYFRLHPLVGVLSNLPVLLGSLALLLPLYRSGSGISGKRQAALLGLTYFASRVLFAVVVVVLFAHVSLDLGTYFETQGVAVLQGRIPYRDFTTSYAPLFPYLMALPAAFPGRVLPLFAFFIACDLAALVALMRAVRKSDPDRAFVAGWIYVAAPVTWYFLVRYAQDEALSAAILSGAYLLFAGEPERRGTREIVAALLLAFGLSATKFTFGIFLVPFALAAYRPRRFLLVLSAGIVAAYLPFLLLGAPVWRPLFGESAEFGFGPSLWRLPVVFTPLVVGRPAAVVLAAALTAGWVVAGRRRLSLDASLLLTGIVFMIFSPKVMPMYITPIWPFAALWIACRKDGAGLWFAAALNLLLGIWWYFDAGGIQGMFGPLVTAVAVVVTAAIPVTLGLLGWKVVRDRGPAMT